MSASPSSPQGRAERLIATGRLVLAAFSLLAIWLDPTTPTKHAGMAYALLAGYLVYALAIALAVWRSPALPHLLPLLTHGFELGLFSLFMYFTEGATSPFFVFYVFSLICAALRWRWRGTLWTGAIALVLFIGMGVYAAAILRDPEFELNRFIIRSVYLAVVAVLLGYVATYEERARSDMSKLAAWPHAIPREARDLVQHLLEQTAAIVGAPRVLMVWEEREEPWLHLAWWSRGEFDWTRKPPGTFQPLVAEKLAGTSFLCLDARAHVPTALHTSPSRLQRWSGSPLHADLRARFAMGPVLSLHLHGGSLEGRLFCLDRPGMTSDDLVLGEIVASQVVARMDRFHAAQRLREAAATEERVRLARDLHDGLLQSLTGVALQLQTVRQMLDEGHPEARDRLLELQRLIAAEQRDLRSFIGHLKPAAFGVPDADSDLPAALEALVDRVQRQWGLRAEVHLERLDGRLSGSLANQIWYMVHEALVNAARHARASAVHVDLGTGDNQVRITVADNGRGFPFHGHYDHAMLVERKLGPAMLRERVGALGGSLAIDSSPAGARLEIRLPLAPSGA